MKGATTDMNVTWILRIESAAVGVLGIVAFLSLGGSPLALIPALLAPDLSMLGYLAGPRVGAVTYNLVHNWALPVGLGLLAIAIGELWPLLAASAVAAHVGWDRALGYGLKLPTGFKDTHLGRIGRI
ncbi:MAG TPA: DUF4260 domain-containing protein [Pleomorphomonadaceae bacterium]|nr:DUF4260 domain-containing protein [Pleomorphomonadaceae bacterium]